MDYAAYIETFCTGDDDALVDRFFHDDVRFTGGSRDHHGKEALRGFLAWAHDGVREVPRVQATAREGDLLFAEVDMDFHASKVRTDFPFGNLRPGQQITVKFFVTYRIEDGRVRELKSMTWPPEYGVTKLPKLGPHPSQLAAYRAYAAAFSAGEFDMFTGFYTDDVVLELASLPPIRGKQGIVDFYRPMFERVRETLIVNSVDATDTTIEVDHISRFTAIEDWPDFVVGPMRRGEWIEVPLITRYTLRDGLITSIRGIRNGEMTRGAA